MTEQTTTDCFTERRRTITEKLAVDLLTFVRNAVGDDAVVSFTLDSAFIDIGRAESIIAGEDFRCVFDNATHEAFIEGKLMSAYNWFHASENDARSAVKIIA